MGDLPMISWKLAPASCWGLFCAESACVTDLKGPALYVVLQWANATMSVPNYRPAGAPFWRGFLVPANGLRGSHCEAAAFEALSCGRDRVIPRSA